MAFSGNEGDLTNVFGYRTNCIDTFDTDIVISFSDILEVRAAEDTLLCILSMRKIAYI